MALDQRDARHVEETVAVIEATMRLATHLLDGFGSSDEELDALCDAALAADKASDMRFGQHVASREPTVQAATYDPSLSNARARMMDQFISSPR